MRMLLYVLISAMSLAMSASPAQAFFFKHLKRHHQAPTGCASCESVSPCADGNCGAAPVEKRHWLHRLIHSPSQPQSRYQYGEVTFNTMPEGIPPGPPLPPFQQPMNYQPIYIPAAPDLMNPGPYGVMPPFAPHQGMLLAPGAMGRNGMGGNGMGGNGMGGNGMGGNGMGPGGPGGPGGGPGVFGTHPFARSPRDYFMVGD